MCFQKNSTVSLDKQLNSLVVMTLNKREKSATCILCSCGTLKTERFRSRHGCLMSVCMLLCVDSERENKIIYIFFRKWKLYYYLKNKNEPKKTGKRKKNTTVANNEFHAMKTISKSDLRRHLHSLP